MIFASEGATGVIETNFTNAQRSWFVDPAGGYLRLADSIATAVNKGQTLSAVEHDFDCEEQPRASSTSSARMSTDKRSYRSMR